MDSELKYWKLIRHLSAKQAAALVVYDEGPETHAASIQVVTAALMRSVRLGELKANVPKRFGGASDGPPYEWLDFDAATIQVDDVKSWLEARNMRPTFFFPQVDHEVGFLDKGHERYAPKLVGADANLTHRADPILTRGWMPTA